MTYASTLFVGVTVEANGCILFVIGGAQADTCWLTVTFTNATGRRRSRHAGGATAGTGAGAQLGPRGAQQTTLTEPPHSARTPVEPLNATQVAQLLAAIKDDRLGPLIHVAIATGLRQGELLGLRWEDVDLTQGTLRVRHAMQRIDRIPTFIEPKTQRSRRVVALPPSAVAALTVQHDRQVFVRQAAGAAWQEWGLVFASAVGTPLNPSNVTHHLQAVLAEVGLPRQRFHDLRHCCASLLLAQHVPARVVMEQLGHSQIALTMNTYSHVMPAMQREAADRMEALLSASAS